MSRPGAAAYVGTLLLLYGVLIWREPAAARALCRRAGLVRPNFRGDRVPVSGGVAYLAAVVPAWAALLAAAVPARATTARFLFVGLAFGLLGLADDLWGGPAARGFGGHLRAAAAGRVTTGFLKLAGGGIAALAASYSLHAGRAGEGTLTTAADAVLIALAANAVNLLDLRPGRAQAAFVVLLAPPAAAALVCRDPRVLPPLLLLGAVARGWAADARGRVMMGDTGANLLGAAAGLAAAELLPPAGRFALLAALLALNGAAERFSLSRRISETPWLAALDGRLGVR